MSGDAGGDEPRQRGLRRDGAHLRRGRGMPRPGPAVRLRPGSCGGLARAARGGAAGRAGTKGGARRAAGVDCSRADSAAGD